MYAIVEIAGHQYKVQQDQRVYVNRLPQDEGAKVSFDRVLLVDNGKQIDVGAPAVKGATVYAVIERHLKGDKVLVFKKKRRKGHVKKNGFRPSLTEISIKGIKVGGAAPKVAAKKAETAKADGDKPAAKKPAAKKPAAKKPAAKKPAAKKPAAKKPAAKKPAAKKPAAKKAADKTENKD
ncbi:MAG: 50S ribosomal protein L21 [Flavobacteriales bacterium]|nr:50S ribosomal protein L21 [Flavobacteriales bacterium]